jgi:predicted ATPase/DNA-binding winged helix-turn-helix (wHTH) protein
MDRISQDAVVITFGRFTLLPQRRLLSADGRLIELGGRALDVLMALVKRPGAVLSHDDLLQLAWPGQVVEENNLQVQISALRKALGADRDLIRTVVGRGYQFTGAPGTALERMDEPEAPNNLPAPTSELIGREAALRDTTALLAASRLLTLTGPGGIGKSRLGLALARRLLPAFADGVWWVDLGGLSGPGGLVAAVAAALRLDGAPADGIAGLVAVLGRQELLLVLDGCEHLIGAVTALAEALLRGCAGVRLMIGSREPLCSDGETVYRLAALSVAPEASGGACAAVQLFTARARGADPDFAPGQEGAVRIAAICAQLDGIPLAIELAAARAPSLGLELLAQGLEDPLRLLAGGHRTALARQRSLRASLDWSHALLGQRERMALRRLAVFAAAFTLEAAIALLARHGMSVGELVDCIGGLVAKSLLLVDSGAAVRRYRLGHTTRAYGRGRLKDRGEQGHLARRHAEYCNGLLSGTGQALLWPADDGLLAEEVRAALDWAFGSHGDAALGAALAAAAAALWMRLSLPGEALRQAQRAQDFAASVDGLDPCHAMQLQAAIAQALLFAPAQQRHEGLRLWRQVQAAAEARGDVQYRLRAIWGLYSVCLDQGELARALQLAQGFRDLAAKAPTPADVLVGERLIGQVLHIMGDQEGARQHLERMLAHYVAPGGAIHTASYAQDQEVAAQADLALVFWLQGRPEQALRLVRSTVDQARGGHAVSLCQALAAACPVALLSGDLGALELYVTLLQAAAGPGLEGAAAGAAVYACLLRQRRGCRDDAAALPAALSRLRLHGDAMQYTFGLGWFADALAGAGDTGGAMVAIDKALARASACKECWGSAEMLRLKGELLLQHDGHGAAAAAERHFQDALAMARRQGALAWELRCATSLARLWRGRGAADQARQLLQPVYGRFGEGWSHPDLAAARTLLAAL